MTKKTKDDKPGMVSRTVEAVAAVVIGAIIGAYLGFKLPKEEK